jgi:hypothetical protein
VVSTGRADENSFSLSIETFNPEAYNIDGVTVGVTIRAADHFNNPVPDGTAISFRTEGGSIGQSCTTTDGACSVNWVSQAPRPSDGRVTILAFAIGNESFTDLNGNGYYDDGDIAGVDLPEPFVNDNESESSPGVPSYDPATEEPVDFNGDQLYTGADGGYTGVLCQHSTNCATATSLYVWEDTVLIMGSSSHDIAATPSSTDGSNICIDATTFTDVTITVDGADGSQYPPSGTSISADTSVGSVEGTGSWTVPNTSPSAGTVWSETVSLTGGGTPGDIGKLTITVQTPSGTPDVLLLDVLEVADKSVSCP